MPEQRNLNKFRVLGRLSATLTKESCTMMRNDLSLVHRQANHIVHQGGIVTKIVINLARTRAVKVNRIVIITMATLKLKRILTIFTLHSIDLSSQIVRSKSRNKSTAALMTSLVQNPQTNHEKTQINIKIKVLIKSKIIIMSILISTRASSTKELIDNSLIVLIFNQTRRGVNFTSITRTTQTINSSKSPILMTLRSKDIMLNQMRKEGTRGQRNSDNMILRIIQTFINRIEATVKEA